MPEIETLIEEISAAIKKGTVTFLVGPGISQPPPSCLPTPDELGSILLDSIHKKNPTLKHLFTDSKTFKTALANLPVEELMQKLEDSNGSLEILDVYKGGTPNPIHYFLAECLEPGNHIISTSIDSLIEKAAGNKRLKIYLANDDFEAALMEIQKDKTSPVLFKVRGSIDTPESLRVTANQIGRSGIGFANEEKKADFFDLLVGKRHLVVLGRPETDDLDIIPRLIYLHNKKKIYWLHHQSLKKLRLLSEDETQDWQSIFQRLPLRVIAGDISRFTGTLRKNVFPESVTTVGTSDQAAPDTRRNLQTVMEQMIEEWETGQPGSVELITGLLLYEGNHRLEALECFSTAKKRFNENGNREGEARALTNLSVLYTDRLEYDRAINCIEESKTIYYELEDVPGLAVSLRNEASLLLTDGKWRKALTLFEESGKRYKACNDLAGFAAVTNSMAQINTDLGEYEKATHLFKKCNMAYKECGDTKGFALSLGNSGRLLYAQGQLEEAGILYQIALYHLNQVEDREGIFKLSNNLGVLYGNQGREKEALEAFKLAEMSGENIGDPTVKMDVLLNKGSMYLRLGNLEEALKALQEGLELSGEIKAPERRAQALGNIGLVLLDQGKAEEAVQYLEKAGKEFEEIGAAVEVAFTYENLGDAHRDFGDKSNAYNLYKEAIKRLEEMRGHFIDEATKISFQHHIEIAYHHMVDLCLAMEDRDDAYRYMGRSKSRAMIDILAAADLTAAYVSNRYTIPPPLLKQEEKLLELLRQVYAKRLSTSELDTEIMSANLDDIYKQMSNLVPEYADMRRGKPLTYKEVQACLK